MSLGSGDVASAHRACPDHEDRHGNEHDRPQHRNDHAKRARSHRTAERPLGHPLLVVGERMRVRWRTVTEPSFALSAADSLPDHSE